MKRQRKPKFKTFDPAPEWAGSPSPTDHMKLSRLLVVFVSAEGIRVATAQEAAQERRKKHPEGELMVTYMGSLN